MKTLGFDQFDGRDTARVATRSTASEAGTQAARQWRLVTNQLPVDNNNNNNIAKNCTKRIDSGWKSKINNSSTMESELWRNAGPSALQLQDTLSKSDKSYVHIC